MITLCRQEKPVLKCDGNLLAPKGYWHGLAVLSWRRSSSSSSSYGRLGPMADFAGTNESLPPRAIGHASRASGQGVHKHTISNWNIGIS